MQRPKLFLRCTLFTALPIHPVPSPVTVIAISHNRQPGYVRDGTSTLPQSPGLQSVRLSWSQVPYSIFSVSHTRARARAHTHMNLRNVCFAAVVVVVPKGGHGVIKQVNTSPKFTQRNGSLAAGPLVSVKRDICCLCFPDLIGIWKLMKWF